MNIFLISFLPLIFIWFSLHSKEKIVFTSGLWGIFAGVINLFLIFLFTNNHKVFTTSFFDNFLYFLTNYYLFPVVIWMIFYVLILKEDLNLRINTLYMFMLGFFVIYLPYCVLFSDTVTLSFYELFIKPVIILSLVVISKFLLKFAVSSFETGKKQFAILYLFLTLLNFAIPSVLEALWIVKNHIVFLMILMILYCVFGIVLFILEICNFSPKNLLEDSVETK